MQPKQGHACVWKPGIDNKKIYDRNAYLLYDQIANTLPSKLFQGPEDSRCGNNNYKKWGKRKTRDYGQQDKSLVDKKLGTGKAFSYFNKTFLPSGETEERKQDGYSCQVAVPFCYYNQQPDGKMREIYQYLPKRT